MIPNSTLLVVGQPYQVGRTDWQDGRPEYNYRDGLHELVLCYGDLLQKDLDDFADGACCFGAYVHMPAIFFLFEVYAVGGGPLPVFWGDLPYSWHRIGAEHQVPIEVPGPGERFALLMVLVDTDGVVQGLRVVSLSPEVSTVLARAIELQATLPFDPASEAAAQKHVFDVHSHQALLADSVSCQGGV